MRRTRTIPAQASGVGSVTLPPTGDVIRIVAVFFSFLTDATAIDRLPIVQQLPAGCDNGLTFPAPSAPASTNAVVTFSPGLEILSDTATPMSPFTAICTARLPAGGLIVQLGDTVTLSILEFQAGDQLGQVVFQYEPLDLPTVRA